MVFPERITRDRILYTAKIHINGDYLIGRFRDEKEAAIAYNKAVDLLSEKGLSIQYTKNYIDGMDSDAYHACYDAVHLPKKLRAYKP